VIIFFRGVEPVLQPCLGFLTLTTGSLVRSTAEAKYEDFVSFDADSKPVEELVLDDISFAFIGRAVRCPKPSKAATETSSPGLETTTNR
jgi:hypothetical protein